MSNIFLAYNGAMQTTAEFTAVTTGTAVKTMLQLKPLTGIDLIILEWGIYLDGTSGNTPGKVELIETDVAATVTAFSSADITKVSNPAGPAADSGLISLGTAASGFTSSGEGSITAVRNLDSPKFISPTGGWEKFVPLGDEAYVQAGKFARIRVRFSSGAVNCTCYIKFKAA